MSGKKKKRSPPRDLSASSLKETIALIMWQYMVLLRFFWMHLNHVLMLPNYKESHKHRCKQKEK